MILSRRWSRRFWSQAKRTMVPSVLFVLALGLNSVQAQVASDKENTSLGGSIGGPDGTNGIYQPRLIYSPNPVYTDAARRKKIQGIVFVKLVVNPNGTTSELRVVQGIDPDLDKEAIKAVSSWRFKPGTKNGQPTAMHVAVEVDFRLDRP